VSHKSASGVKYV